MNCRFALSLMTCICLVLPTQAQSAGRKLALLVGSEGDGLTREALDAATLTARIPMTPAVDSLNVTTAASIAMYHCFAERRPSLP
jgi:tRNA G18 (ribose-2'-O)-methylase SpoU